MTMRSEKYAEAVKAYLKPEEVKAGQLRTIHEEIVTFLNSDEWSVAIELLEASKKVIDVGSGSIDLGYFTITGKGFCRKIKDDERDLFLGGPVGSHDEEIKAIALAYHYSNFGKVKSFLEYVYGDLDAIAANCPPSL